MSRPIKKRKFQKNGLESKSIFLRNSNFNQFLANQSIPQNGSITREQASRLGLPDRWLYCPPIGNVSCFFKVYF